MKIDDLEADLERVLKEKQIAMDIMKNQTQQTETLSKRIEEQEIAHVTKVAQMKEKIQVERTEAAAQSERVVQVENNSQQLQEELKNSRHKVDIDNSI